MFFSPSPDVCSQARQSGSSGGGKLGNHLFDQVAGKAKPDRLIVGLHKLGLGEVENLVSSKGIGTRCAGATYLASFETGFCFLGGTLRPPRPKAAQDS